MKKKEISKKKVFIVILLFNFVMSCIVFAHDETDIGNTSPKANIDASIVQKKKVNIQVITDYTGTKATNVMTKLNNFKSNLLSKGVSARYSIVDGNNYLSLPSGHRYVDTSKLLIEPQEGEAQYIILLSDGIGSDISMLFGQYYSFGDLNTYFASKLITNNYSIYAVTPSVNFEYKLPASTLQNMTIGELVSSSPVNGGLYDSTSTGGLSKLDDLLNVLNNGISNATTSLNGGITQTTKLVDFVVATDYTGAKLSSLNSALNQMKSDLYPYGVDLKPVVIDGNNKTKIGSFRLDSRKFSTIGGVPDDPSAESSNQFVIKGADNQLWVKGNNTFGELGLGNTNYVGTFTQVPNFNNVKAITNKNYVIALKYDKSLWIWGYNYDGANCDSYWNEIRVPTQVTSISGVIDFATNDAGAIFVLREDRTIWVWGKLPSYGILRTPTKITGITDIVDISCSNGNMLTALKSDGTVWKVSDFSSNPLTSTPVKLPGFSDVVSIYSSSTSTYGIKKDRTLVGCYYQNSKESIGYDIYSSVQPQVGYPIPNVGGDFAQVCDDSGDGVFGLKTDGSVWYIPYDYHFNYTYPAGRKLSISNVVAIQSSGIGRTYPGVLALNNQGQLFRLYTTTYFKTNYVSVLVDDEIGVSSLDVDINSVNSNAVTQVIPRTDSDRYFAYVSDGSGKDFLKPYGEYYSFGSLSNTLKNYINSNNFSVYTVSNPTDYDTKLSAVETGGAAQELSIRQLIAGTVNEGKFYNAGEYTLLLNYIKNRYMTLLDTRKQGYMLVGEEALTYTKYYEDFELDPKYAERWRYNHNKSFFENNIGDFMYTDTSGIRVPNNSWSTLSTNLVNEVVLIKTGEYSISHQAQDNPTHEPEFAEYRGVSIGENQIRVYVNRRPLSNFTYTLNGTSFTMTNLSYDLDHLSMTNKGIDKTIVKYKKLSDGAWTIGQPTSLDTKYIWIVAQQVKDIDGFTSLWKTHIIGNVNNPPVAEFKLTKYNMEIGTSNTITDLSYDPDGDPIVQRAWKLYDQFGNLIRDYGGTTLNFSTLTEGEYILELKVQDNPAARSVSLAPLWSQPYRIYFVVLDPLTITGEVTTNPARAGERIYIKCRTTGYGETVIVTFWNGQTITLIPEQSITSNNNTWNGSYIVPLDTKNNTYGMTATVYKGAKSATTNLTVTIVGNMLELVKPRIIESN